jgi:hypothetical protein
VNESSVTAHCTTDRKGVGTDLSANMNRDDAVLYCGNLPELQDDLHGRVSKIVEAAAYPESLLNSYQTTRRHVPEDMSCPQYQCDDLKNLKAVYFNYIYKKAFSVISHDERLYVFCVFWRQ